MTMELQRAACRGALMAPTREMKNVDRNDEDDRKERLAKLIRDNVRPIQPRSAFDLLAILAPLNAERLKLIADVFVAMRQFEPRQPDEHRDLSREPARGVRKTPRKSDSAERLIAELAKIHVAIGQAERTAEDAAYAIEQMVIEPPHPPRRSRRRKMPSNVIALKPRAAKETTGAGGDGPKAAS